MSIGRTTSLFFDASCLIAAAGSPTGGSGFLLSLCARRMLRAVVSQVILYEAERNILEKRGQAVLRAYHSLLISVPFIVASVPIVPTAASWLKDVNAKDAHVVASVLANETPYCNMQIMARCDNNTEGKPASDLQQHNGDGRMTEKEFRSSLSAAMPPAGLTPALEALWYAAKGNWDKAHDLTQPGGSELDWVHAYLHRVEGDLSNAGYWYRRVFTRPTLSHKRASTCPICCTP